MKSTEALGISARKLLLVEDNPNDEMLALRAFQAANLVNNISVVRDGAEALDYLFAEGKYAYRKVEKLPVVVFLDLKLPKLDGLEVLKRLRGDERTAMLPVVVLTSSDEENDQIASYRLGANSYVRKPVEFTSFIEAIQNLGLYWIRLNDPPPPVRG